MRLINWMAEHWIVVLLAVFVVAIAVAGAFGWWIFDTNDDEHGDW